jgi:hypothetical protein
MHHGSPLFLRRLRIVQLVPLFDIPRRRPKFLYFPEWVVGKVLFGVYAFTEGSV